MRSLPRLAVLCAPLVLLGCPDPTPSGEPDAAVTPDASADGGGDAETNGGCSPASCASLNVPGTCTLWACNPVSGACEERSTKDYVPCAVEDACFDGGFCQAGVCQVTAKNCGDGNPCTDDSCDPATGCVNDYNTDPCDDGNACTVDEACNLGDCRATDLGACGCASDLDCALFEDGDLCNGRIACIDDVCQVSPGSVVVCDSSSNTACFFTSCNPDSGQCETTAPAGTPCEDGSSCTVDDTCAAGVCESGASKCGCDVDADCADFDDGNACNGTLVCNAGLCEVSLASVISCQNTPTAACEMAVCNANSGACEVVPRPDGDPCDDGDACTVATTCAANGCQGGVPLDCEDGNPCTDHACDSATGCATSLTDCDDGDACTVDACDEAIGCANAPLTCDDDNVCTTDTCDATGGGCAHDPITCDDGDACTTDLCDAATGCYGVATACPDDGDPCTVETCDAVSGCASDPKPCDDDDVCTTDSCDPTTGACDFVAIICDDGDACTTDGCDSATGCTTSPVVCDDSDACTADGCDSATGCTTAPVVCDDGDACTTDGCDAATGCTTAAVTCDDGDLCTTDGCDPGTGCTATPVACPEDGDLCTDEVCDASTGQCESTPKCRDGTACTQDVCDPATGACTHVDACDDHYDCTVGTCAPLGAEASALSCDALGWSLPGTREVCVDALGPAGSCGQGTFTEARDACQAVGARLCDAEEVASEAALVDRELCGTTPSAIRAWTSSTCPGGNVAIDTRRDNHPECSGPADQARIVCCADAVPATAGRCEQTPVGDDPSCHGITDISVGEYNRPCFVLAGGQLQCAGSGVNLPLLVFESITHPQRFFGAGHWNNRAPLPVVQTDTDFLRRCLVDASGALTCFGEETFSAIDFIGALESKTYDLGVPVLQVAVGDRYLCARPAQGLLCWGANPFGQLGLGHLDDVATPTPVPFFDGMSVDQIATSRSEHTCVRSDGDVYCWGSNFAGQLGQGDTQPELTPALVTLPGAAVDVDVHGAATAVVLDSGEIWVFGFTFGATPVQVSFGGGDPFVKVGLGNLNGPVVAGLDSAGLLWTTGAQEAIFWPPGKTDAAANNNATPRATELFRLFDTVVQTKAGGRIEDNDGVWPRVGNLGSVCDTDFDCWSHYCNAGECDLPCSDDDGFDCTVTRAVLDEVSPSTCDAVIGFTFEGSSEVCAYKLCGTSPHADAAATCAASGGRLCRADEVLAGVTVDGCTAFGGRGWTSTPCGDNRFMALRFLDPTDSPRCDDAGTNRHAYCCADQTRSPPRACRHIPDWASGECCNVVSGTANCN